MEPEYLSGFEPLAYAFEAHQPTWGEQLDAAAARELLNRRKRLAWPPWVTLRSAAGAFTMLGFAAYVCQYTFTYAFLQRFGTTPEEVGLTQPAYIVRAAVFGSIGAGTGLFFGLFLSLLLFMVFAFVVMLGVMLYKGLRTVIETIREVARDIARARRSATKRTVGRQLHEVMNRQFRTRMRYYGSRRRLYLIEARTAITVAFGSVTVSLIAAYSVSSGQSEFWLSATMVLGLTLFILVPLARYRHFIALGLIAVALFASCVSGAKKWGEQVADGYRKSRTTAFPLATVGLQADDVDIDWLVKPTPTDIPTKLILLGHSDSVFLLSDGQQLFRVRDNQIIVVFCPPMDKRLQPLAKPAC